MVTGSQPSLTKLQQNSETVSSYFSANREACAQCCHAPSATNFSFPLFCYFDGLIDSLLALIICGGVLLAVLSSTLLSGFSLSTFSILSFD